MDNSLSIWRIINRLLVLIITVLIGKTSYTQTALEFGGVASHITISDEPSLHIDSFTIECWVQLLQGGSTVETGAVNVNAFPLFSRGENKRNFFLGIREQDQVLYFEYDAYDAFSNSYPNYHLSGFTPIAYEKWYHVAATCSGTKISIYLNGHLEASLETFHPSDTSINGSLGIGATFASGSISKGAFRGKIDAIRIWNRARSQQEILTNMNSELPESSSGLIIALNLNEGSGNMLSSTGEIEPGSIITNAIAWCNDPDFSSLIPPLVETDPILSIGLISDPQYCNCDKPDWAERYYRESLWKLPVAVDTFNAQEVDFVVTLGDVIDKDYASYDSILPLYENLDMEYHFIMGNHELEIEDTSKAYVLERLGMPDYYYSLDTAGWKFLFLDGTELAEYARNLHPEHADEGDSLIEAVTGQINDKPWNGGISRKQQQWMRNQIEEAQNNKQKVVLFSHFPIFPDSMSLNLWNKDTIVNLLSDYDNVVAYINGHHHYGNYGFTHGQHYFTQYGMVESADSNSFTILNIYPDQLQLEGFGYNASRTLPYVTTLALPRPELIHPVLSYRSDSFDFVGRLETAGFSNNEVAYKLIDEGNYPDNTFFSIRNDSVFLQEIPDFRNQTQFSIKIGVINGLFDSVSTVFQYNLDTLAVTLKHPLADTTLPVGTGYIIVMDSVFTDGSRYGLSFSYTISDTSVVRGLLENNTLNLLAVHEGNTSISITAFDSYTNQFITTGYNITASDTGRYSNHSIPDNSYRCCYPNPVYDFISLHLPETLSGEPFYHIYNPLGQLSDSDRLTKSISVANLPEGFYYLVIHSKVDLPQIFKFTKTAGY